MGDYSGSVRPHPNPRHVRNTVNPFPTLEDVALVVVVGAKHGGIPHKREPGPVDTKVRIRQMKVGRKVDKSLRGSLADVQDDAAG